MGHCGRLQQRHTYPLGRRRMERVIDSFLRGRSRGFLLVLAAALVGLVGWLDYTTGYDLSLSLFYLAPVALLAWYDNRRTAFTASLLSALAWALANTLAVSPGRLTPTLLAWNTAIRLGFFLIVAQLLSSLRAIYALQRSQARTDSLTGVHNARTFREVAQAELLRSQRIGYPLSLIYLDLDNFKTLNDQRGHSEGDVLLRSIGRGLSMHLRGTDIVGRLGGDEFAVLLPNTDREQAAIVASKLHSLLDASAKAVDPRVSLSMGVLTSLSPAPEVEALISAADKLMYEAKNGGKDVIRHGVYEPARRADPQTACRRAPDSTR
jgi:diguanylate cyclase (GGDEF)-like protein